ncbi:hypothetical protein T05_4822 [Trichinella murrelli]|uniref:Uncharacterized protein n=1 Tax=Trichinella murrelli TaxID=144512 RepID=A0A0V0TU45_9BILA|nr:hypothetical protein T05_4822 [Trichinella murrelli]
MRKLVIYDIIVVQKMKLMYCMLVVLFLAFNEAQRIDYIKRAQDALFLWNWNRHDPYKKIITVRNRRIEGTRIIFGVDLQDTVCIASQITVYSYDEMVRVCPPRQGSRVRYCAIYYEMGDIRTTQVYCESDVELVLVAEGGRSDPEIKGTGGTIEYNVSHQDFQDTVRRGVFEWDKKRKDGKYHLVKRVINGSRSGILSSFEIVLDDASCPVRTNVFDNYQDVYRRCAEQGHSRECVLEFKYLDEKNSEVHC